MWNLKHNTKELTYKIERLTEIENKVVVTNGRKEGEK